MKVAVSLWCFLIPLAIVIISALLVTAVLLLVKLGVIARYAVKQEPEERAGEYSLEQSREV